MPGLLCTHNHAWLIVHALTHAYRVVGLVAVGVGVEGDSGQCADSTSSALDDRICSPPFMELTSLCGEDTMRLLEQNGLAFPFSMYTVGSGWTSLLWEELTGPCRFELS
jgi:hypothetical protein